MNTRRAFAIASVARAVTVVLIAVRAKVVALLLGPEGTGLLGLLTAAQEIGAQAADAGLSHSAVRQVARTSDRPLRVARIRRALAVAMTGAAIAGGLLMWLGRKELSQIVTGSTDHASSFGWLALGLALGVLFRWRQALLTGYRRVSAVAGGTILGTALATGLGIVAVSLWGRDGLVFAAVAAPAAGLVGLLAMGRLPVAGPVSGRVLPEAAVLARLGVSLMLIAQMALVAPMVLRVWITHQVGLDQAGLFHAAWTVSAQIMAVLLMAVGVDFYPKVSGLMTCRREASAALDDQIRVHLWAGGPCLLLTATAAPWVLSLLYSDQFVPAASLLHGLAIGGIARLVSAPLETVLTAGSQPRLVLIASVGSLLGLVTGSILIFPVLGLSAIGLAFAVSQFAHLGAVTWAARRRVGVWPATSVLIWAAGLAVLGFGLALAPPAIGVAASAVAALAGLYALGIVGTSAKSLGRPAANTRSDLI